MSERLAQKASPKKLLEQADCKNCKVFKQFVSHPQRALLCETARAVDDCLKDKVLVDAQQQLDRANKNAREWEDKCWRCDAHGILLDHQRVELEGRLQHIRKQWTQKLHEIKKAMIPHADICRKCLLRKTVCSKQQKAHPSFGCNAIKNLGEAYHVLCEFERELAVLPEEVEK